MPCAIWYHLQAWYHDIKLRNAPHIGFFFQKKRTLLTKHVINQFLEFFFFFGKAWASLTYSSSSTDESMSAEIEERIGRQKDWNHRISHSRLRG